MARMCWENLKEKGRKVESGWEKEKRRYFREKGMQLEKVEKRRGEGDWFGKVVRVDREMQGKDRWERMGRSEYNVWYKEVKGEGLPRYLRKGWGRAGGEK